MSVRQPLRLFRRHSWVGQTCRKHLDRTSRSATFLQKRRITHNHIVKIRDAQIAWEERAKSIEAGQKKSVLEVLEERGYVNQIVGNRDDLRKLLNRRRVSAYTGIDPTAPSMHVGHMVPFMALSWLFIHGYGANFLLGGFTARIGDPTDRLTARSSQGSTAQKANMAAMHVQLKRFGSSMEKYAERRGYHREWAWRRALLNNNTWWGGKTLVFEFMRTLGRNVRLGPMLGRDTVKNRMEKGDGMSYAEFSYPLIQAWDWWEMYQTGTQIQIGGADQFGNILAGAEAIKQIAKTNPEWQQKMAENKSLMSELEKEVVDEPMGFTVPLLTTAAGEKFGKSVGNAVWLDESMTSTFDLYQFFLRSADADVEKYLKLFTFLPLSDIAKVMEGHQQDESKRVAQHLLAKEFVELVHGLNAAQEAEAKHRQLFNKSLSVKDIQDSIEQTALPQQSGAPPPELHPALNKHARPLHREDQGSAQMTLPRSLVFDQPLSRVIFSAGLASSRTEGQKLINNHGVYIGARPDQKGGMDDSLAYVPARTSDWEQWSKYIIDDNLLILRTGKWRVKIIKIVPDQEYQASGLTSPGWNPKLAEAIQESRRELTGNVNG